MADTELPPLLAALAMMLPPELFQALKPIFDDIGACLDTIGHTAAAAQASSITTGQLQTVLQNALSNAQITVQAPVNAVSSMTPMPITSTQTASIKADLPLFRGRESEDVSAWISIIEDYLTMQHVPAADWVPQKKLRDENKTLDWDQLKDWLQTYKGNLIYYAEKFQMYKSQIPAKEMTFGDRLSYFLSHLPAKLARDLRQEKPKTTKDMYHSV
ncbi:hypothetical protein CERSUDRAFT_74898 [Gelatoporia subvermispora B]|uniref:Retrotransposon gag domain-containing protein n=1 Tax=Ceriporiopsis subvermispora (strain B) TaxID=914234 RepID=M2QDX7_CERS8|nr:hypothetical protein CERSUDRAFT_74898 [Gelatoporia subvermispora B]